MHIVLNIKVDCRILWKMWWLVPWGRKMCKSRLLFLRQHLMYFWLEDFVNKVSCCFESILNAKGLCWHSQGPVKTGGISDLCVLMLVTDIQCHGRALPWWICVWEHPLSRLSFHFGYLFLASSFMCVCTPSNVVQILTLLYTEDQNKSVSGN